MGARVNRVPFLVAGAGICGLAAVRALPRGSFAIRDGADAPGGLCRSFARDGYTFDCTGHLLHVKGEALARIESLIGPELAVVERDARIRLHGRDIPYPFQAHLGWLPGDLRDECLEGFRVAAATGRTDERDFGAWCRSVFGEGITRVFMRPYNEKLLGAPLESLSADWVGYIPRPRLEDVEAGAAGSVRSAIGYNASFRYPRRGGIGILPTALSSGVPVGCGAPLEEVLAGDRVARFGGERIAYERLISTVPLPALVAAAADAPAEVRAAAGELEAAGVLCLNLGVAGSTSDAHWIYFPDPGVPFFRVGFYHNIMPSSAPPGHSALYVEIPYRSRAALGTDIRDRALAALEREGILPDRSRVEVCQELWIDHAYAVHTPRRAASLGIILPWLERVGILPAGRYGRWAYTSMGEAILEGEGAAARAQVLSRSAACPFEGAGPGSAS